MKSPAAAGRSAVCSRASRSRMASISCWICSSATSGSRRPTSRPLYWPSSAFGSTPISIENSSAWPCGGSSPRSSCGSPTGTMPALSIASEYQLESVSRTASSSTTSRPIRWMTSGAGTLPRRKPGSFSSRPSCCALRSSRPSTSPGGTCTCRRTRESPSSVTVVWRAGRFGDSSEASVSRFGGTPATIPCRPMRPQPSPPLRRRAEAWLWTGPAGHLVGGSLDFLAALARYLLARARGRALRQVRPARPHGRRRESVR